MIFEKLKKIFKKENREEILKLEPPRIILGPFDSYLLAFSITSRGIVSCRAIAIKMNDEYYFMNS